MNKIIDQKHEEILKKVIKKFNTYHDFMNTIIEDWTFNELMYDNISKNDNNYNRIRNTLYDELKDIVKDPYKYEMNKQTLIELNNKLLSLGIRNKKIIHRAFMHNISAPETINSELDELFENLNNEDMSLDNYFNLIYKLYQIYPFWHSLTLRVFTNIYLLQNEYLPFYPSLEIKSEYYETFKYEFFRFKKLFSRLLLNNGDYLIQFINKK